VRLAEFCLALPGRLKLRDGWTRWVMRRAMEGILPHEVQWRVEKSNLSPMLTRGLSLYGRTAIDNLLAAPDTIAPYVDLDYVRSAWSRFSSQPDPRLVMTLWLPLVLARGLESGGLSRQTTVEPGLRYAERDSAVRVDAAVSP
jgi:asparagine synthase (glutamine-hydrolysing)